ncbi:NADH dehydrogenase subunit F [Rhodococcus sp. HNM0563]|uniref:NADH-ubiquinone oxidoreductase-F iron-sulfur binding region domain-containing protein n=1 Tax=Rhodococcus sp. HNM0563 TaxID=2716339 RepID=UPI00146AEE9B|nr:NADH-ubiquinone oxidoreductase-F iron-sulfur binding region domain-containing protein [Rhodococcus sp. HNM0563]NLU62986.1 NADH dehydrogenase subunit F [Rhodococcus sp. HNM0563]
MTLAMPQTALHRAPDFRAPARVVGGTPARLALPAANDPAWGLADERALGFFGAPVEGDAFLAELEVSGLRGRGGAGFPAHRKFAAVASAPGDCVVVANGHEGEPASAKDRWLLTHRPHLVLDGLLVAAAVTGASDAIVYVSDPELREIVDRAVSEITAAGLVPAEVTVRTHLAEHTYVAGEESAVCRSINGFPAKPTSKPPRPFESGVRGLPTLINNVETLAHVAWIRRHGAQAFAATGSASSTGTALFTLTGAVAEPGVYEMSLGEPISALIAAGGGSAADTAGLLVGGWFGGVLTGDHSTLRCCYDAVREAGGGLGCAAVTVLDAGQDVVALAGELSAWFQSESAMQCGVCVSGTNAIARAFRQVLRGDAAATHHENLIRWGSTLSGRGACSFIDGAANLARTAGPLLAAEPLDGKES